MTPRSSFHRKRSQAQPKLPTVALIGCGNWGTALALALNASGVPLREIVVRKMPRDKQRKQFGARLTLLAKAKRDADVFWICTPDAAIASAAEELAHGLQQSSHRKRPIVFHSSGALASTELAVLQAAGASVASVHPLMTFPGRSTPQTAQGKLCGVSFAIEGDARACGAARKLVRAMGGEPFALAAESKPLYHAFGAFASPMLVALLTAAVETAVAAGFTPAQARSRMRPIVERTIANFFAEGAEKSFSGPIARGDAATIARHLHALHAHPRLRTVYGELARFALTTLPARNKQKIRQLLDADREKSGE